MHSPSSPVRPVGGGRGGQDGQSARWQSAWRRFGRAREGATAIEFAMVALPFMITLYAIIQISLLYFAESMLETGVAEAARMIRTGQAQADAMDEAAIRTLVCSHVFGLIDCDEGLVVDVRAFPSFEDVAVPPPVGGDGEIAAGTFNAG